TLAPGAEASIDTDYTVTQADVDAGSVLNKALVSTESPDGENPSDEDEIETEIDRNAIITIIKSDNGAAITAAGEVITYTITVENTGNVTLENVTITDPLTGLDQNIGTLAPGAEASIDTDYTVTQADVDAGSVLNKALVSTESPDGENPGGEDEIETEIDRNATITIIKSDNGATITAAGEVITYTITVENTGNVTLENVTITDPLTGLDQNIGTLAPGAEASIDTDYTVTQADVDAGSVLNKALVSTESPDGENPGGEDEIETEIDRNATITIIKSDNGAAITAAGEVITYTITVENTGNVTLENVTITDPLTGLDQNIGTLAPGAEASIDTDYTVTQADVDAGSVLNKALVSTESPDGENPGGEDEIETEIDRNATITIIKSDNGATITAAGEVITYTITVENTGNVTLENVTITDPLTGLDQNIGTLAPGAEASIDTDYTVTQADVDAGSVLNKALVSTESPDGENPGGEDEIETEIDRNATITIIKSDNGAAITAAGEVITYTITVENTGNVTLENVTITDPLTGLDQNIGTLAPGAEASIDTDYTVTQEDVDAGSVLNKALVSTESPDGENPGDEDEIETEIDRNATITIIKSDNGATITAAGEVITYTITVENTGNVTLENVTITDPLTGLDQNIGTLAPGAEASIDTDYTVTQADVDAGSVLNKALVSTESPDGENPEGEDEIETEIDRNAIITIIKSDNGAAITAAGEVITYTITVENTGNVTLENVTITDPLTGLDQNIGTLAPGAEASIDTDYTVTQADVDAGSVLNK
ncbi:hypothetical protein MM239_20645, partial [Belliella sp. DSM 111904]|nr:hypothetical protein [Belliella filtrata]